MFHTGWNPRAFSPASCSSDGKEPTCNEGDLGLIPGQGTKIPQAAQCNNNNKKKMNKRKERAKARGGCRVEEIKKKKEIKET